MTPPDASASPLGRHSRRGFGLGTAILTARQLKEVHTRIKQAFNHLNDPTIEVLQQAVEERLRWAGIEVDALVPLRAFANRSIIDPAQADPSSMAYRDQLEKVEQAILERHAIEIREPRHASVRVWPLQILFHNIGWYLAYETDAISPVLTVARLDRLQLHRVLRQQRKLQEMQHSQERLHRLCRRTGGIFLGDNHEHQQLLAAPTLEREQIEQLVQQGIMQRVRFRCAGAIYTFIREGNNRYPTEQMKLSAPLPADSWSLPRPAELQPDPNDASHPYPVEIILPCWTAESDIDFRRWLFGFGDRIRIEAPDSLRNKHRDYGAGIAALYPSPEPAVIGPAEPF